MISIKLSTKEDAKYIAFNLREADKQELKALGIKSNYGVLKDALSHQDCYTAYWYQKPIAMFGIAPVEEFIGSIWLVGTDDITDTCPVSFLRYSKRVLSGLIGEYRMACNMVDKRNKVHVEWLKWLGFSFIREVTFGPENNTFYEFAKVKE